MNHQVITHDVEPLSNLDLLVGMISKTADEEQFGALRPVSTRLPLLTVVSLDALAAHSGQSRNKIISKALDAALEMLWNELPPVERATIEAHRSMLLTKALNDLSSVESGTV